MIANLLGFNSTDLPDGWEIRKLKYISNIESSGVWGDDPDGEGTILPVATTANLDRLGNIDFESMTPRKLSSADLKKGLCQTGDIIVVKSSGSATNVISGKAALVTDKHPRFCFGNFMLRVRPDPEVVSSKFLFWFLTSHIARARILRMVSTTTYGPR